MDLGTDYRSMRRPAARIWALAAATMLVLSGCASTAATGGATSGDSTGHPADTTTASPDRPVDLASRDDLTDEHPIEWTRPDIVDDTSIRVHVTLESPSCHGVRTTTRETDALVTITVYAGTLPDAPDVCPANAALASLLITTDQPIGDRELVSG